MQQLKQSGTSQAGRSRTEFSELDEVGKGAWKEIKTGLNEAANA